MTRTRSLVTYLGIALAGACSADNPNLEFDCEDGRCDVDAPDSEVAAHPCDEFLIDMSGRRENGQSVKHTVNRLNDPFIRSVFLAEASDFNGVSLSPCPTNFDEVVAKLAATDNANCTIETRIISEQGQILNKDDDAGKISYRAVTARACEETDDEGNTRKRDQSDFVFSAFGFNNLGSPEENPMDITGTGLPEDVEIIAFDESAGVFNYYKALEAADGSGNKFHFFGNSKDFLDKSPEGPGLTDVRGCGNCHTSGGLIMKELDSPWIHWQPDVSGGRELVQNRSAVKIGEANGEDVTVPAMGQFTLGEFLESRVVEPGNKKWNATKINHLRDNGEVRELLRPLFCPTDFNIQTGSRSGVEDTFLFDPILTNEFQFRGADTTATANNPLSFGLNGDDYDTIIGAFEQKVKTFNMNTGRTITIADDLAKQFSFVERSFADGDYIRQLVQAGVIDAQLLTDILMVDFTRPLHSNERCGILALPSMKELFLERDDQTPEKIRQELIKALEGSSADTGAGQLLAHLQATEDGSPLNHQATLDRFSNACEARAKDAEDVVALFEDDPTTVKGIHLDVMKLRSMQRKLVFGEEGLSLQDILAENPAASLAGDGFEGLFKALRDVAFKPASVFEFGTALPVDGVEVFDGADDIFQIDPDAHLSPIDCKLTTGFTAVTPPDQE